MQKYKNKKPSSISSLATTLFIISLLTGRSTSRFIDGNAEKGGTITSIYEDDEILFAHHQADKPRTEEAVEDNEVISVRLLNSHHLIPTAPNSAEMQNISYENVQEQQQQQLDTAASSVNEYLLESTTTAEPETTSPTTESVTTIPDDSLEADWIRSRIEIPDSSERSLAVKPATTKPTTEISFELPTSTVKTPVATTTDAPRRVFYGVRQRRVRNNDYYDDLPDIDFDQLDLDSLEETRFNIPRLRDLLKRRFATESEEEQQPVRHSRKQQNHQSAKQPNLKLKECPCQGQQPRPKPVENNAAHHQPEQQQQHQPLPRLKRLLTGHQHRRLADDILDDETTLSNLSIERAERVEGALERIMGIASIVSHVDRFIQQKTKQSIRRLAKLYESSSYEEVEEYDE